MLYRNINKQDGHLFVKKHFVLAFIDYVNALNYVVYHSRFLPFVRVQCSIALAGGDRLGEKLSLKNEN